MRYIIKPLSIILIAAIGMFIMITFSTTLEYTYRVTYNDGSVVEFVGEEPIMLYKGCFYLPHPLQGQICGVKTLELIKQTTVWEAVKEAYDRGRRPAKIQGSEWD